MAPEPSGSEDARIFGKVFEEEYSLETHLQRDERGQGKASLERFEKSFSARLREEGIFSSERVRESVGLYQCLLRAGVRGKKPRTRFRKLREGVYLAAQPDIESPTRDPRFVEFKTYSLTPFARAQTRVFAWVLQETVRLVGVRKEGDRYVPEAEKIGPEELGSVDIPEGVGTPQEFCPKHEVPVGRCFPRSQGKTWR